MDNGGISQFLLGPIIVCSQASLRQSKQASLVRVIARILRQNSSSSPAQITLPVRAKDRMRAQGGTGTGYLAPLECLRRKGQLLAALAGIISNQGPEILNDLISGATGLEITYCQLWLQINGHNSDRNGIGWEWLCYTPKKHLIQA